jgi:hypothetical protein
MTAPIHLNGLTDRKARIDTFQRFTQGLDQGDQQLIASAYTEDAVLDLTPVSVMGFPFGTLATRAKLMPHLINGVDKLDTLHLVVNWRVDVRGHTAAAALPNIILQVMDPM